MLLNFLRRGLSRFRGFARNYQSFRPLPPEGLVDTLREIAGRSERVVDFGCGTALSTEIWVGHAEEIVGIDHDASMLKMARQRVRAPQVRFHRRSAYKSGLPSGWADVITYSQCFHWMDPRPALAEAARVLRPGGVVAISDCEWPPNVGAAGESAFAEFRSRTRELARQRRLDQTPRWNKALHLQSLLDSGYFQDCRELRMGRVDVGNAQRLYGLALTLGHVPDLRHHGLSDAEIGLDAFWQKLDREVGQIDQPWNWTYVVRVGLRR